MLVCLSIKAVTASPDFIVSVELETDTLPVVASTATQTTANNMRYILKALARVQQSITWCVTWLAMASVAMTEVLQGNGCKYELQMPEVKCNTVELESQLNDMSAKQAVSDGRINAITTTFKGELTLLSRDVSGTKTVLNRLVEDSVKIQNRIRTLSDLGDDVVGLRKEVTDLDNGVDDKVSGIKAQMDQVEQASRSITTYLNGQLKANKDALALLRHDIESMKTTERQLLSKVAQLEKQAVTQPGSNVQGSQLLRSLDLLRIEFAKFKNEVATSKENTAAKLETLEGRINDLLQ